MAAALLWEKMGSVVSLGTIAGYDVRHLDLRGKYGI